jgi:hypothetical protein
LEQFRAVRGRSQDYDSCMNFTFSSPGAGPCSVKLWASGRYGFSLPKKVDIVNAHGEAATFLYYNRKLRLTAELSNRAIVKIAIAQFLAGAGRGAEPAEIDPATAPYEGVLTPTRAATPRAPLRVRPGKPHARMRPELRPDPQCEPSWADQ